MIEERRQIMIYEEIYSNQLSLTFFFLLQRFFYRLGRMKTLVGFARKHTEAFVALAFTNSMSNIVNERINGNRLCRQTASLISRDKNKRQP